MIEMIPKVIHYFWIGEKPLGEKEVKCIESWKKFCPDYEFKLWNERNYDFSVNKYMSEALEAKKYGFVPDYARLDVIYNYGGIYLDTDVELVKPLDNLLKLKGFCGFENNQKVNLGQIFAAEAGHEIIKLMRDEYEGLSFLNENGSLNTTASPVIQTNSLRRVGLKLDGKKQLLTNGFIVFPQEFFSPYDFETETVNCTNNTYSIHHYAATWYSEIDKIRHKRIVYLNTHLGMVGKICATIYRTGYNIKSNGVKKTFDKILKKS